jgi:hypothetical protein
VTGLQAPQVQIIMKRATLAISLAFVVSLVALTVLHVLPRRYYRYGNGMVYLVDNPNACWNGLWRGPVLEFEVPLFARADAWAPSPDKIRNKLARSYPDLSKEQITQVVRSCVPCGSSTR